MGQGQTSPRAEALADDLGRSVESFEPSTNTEQALYAQGLERVHDLEENREIRLLNVRDNLPPILWIALIILGIDTVVFTYFVGMKSFRLHRLTVAALAGGIALILFTINQLEQPFGTEFRVGPDSFEQVLYTIEESDVQGT